LKTAMQGGGARPACRFDKEERMNRIKRRAARSRRGVLVFAAVLSTLAVAATVAQARVVTITGGQATFTPSDQLTHALSSHGVTTEAIDPATLSDEGVLSLPVIGGKVQRSHLYGYVALGGGVKFSKGSHSVALRRLVAVHRAKGSFLTARVRGERRVIARFIHIHKSVSDHTATLSADAVLSAEAAALINAAAHHRVVHRGAPLGSVSATVTLG
jgi:hypothetical protein